MELRDVRAEASPESTRVTWTQAITKPMRLNLSLDVTVVGDAIHWHSSAGRLPKSAVTGTLER